MSETADVERHLFRISNFVNVGIAFVSVVFVVQFLIGSKEAPDLAIINPVIAYSIAALVAAYGVRRSSYTSNSFDFMRDSLPFLIFLTCALLAGARGNWLWLALTLGLAASAILTFHAKNEE